MKRPAVQIALCYLVGLLLAEYFPLRLSILFGVSFALLFVALISPTRRVFLIWPLILMLGYTNLAVQQACLSPNDVRLMVRAGGEDVRIQGKLLETPSERVFERKATEVWRSLAQVEVTGIWGETNWVPATGRVMTTTRNQMPPEFFSGQPVIISGTLIKPTLPAAEGLFDYRNYLARQGIYCQLKVDSTSKWELGPSAKTELPLTDRFLNWAQGTLAHGIPPQVKDQPLRLIWAMTLGWRPGLTSEVSEPFMRSGTMHIFAISGLHIAFIAGILVSLLRLFQMPRFWCGLVVIPLIWFYTAATGWQSSAIRSTIMMTIIIGGWALRRPSDLLNSLAVAALIILVWQPQQLFQASFQLSFFVVLSIALFLPPLEKLLDRWLAHDPLLAPSLIPRWRRWSVNVLRWLGRALATSVAAWLGSLPLTMYYFHLFSPVTLLANLIVVPLSSVALAANLGGLVFGDWFPSVTELFNHAGWGSMWLMTVITQWATKVPYGFTYVRAPGFWDFVIYYALLIGTLNGWLFRQQWRKWTAVGLVTIAGFYGWRWHVAQHQMELTVLPLNGGHSVFIDQPGQKHDWLIDCGATNSVEGIMKPFLRAQGHAHLNQLTLTHGDIKQVGGFRVLEDLFGVDQISMSPINFRSPIYKEISADLEDQPAKQKMIRRGDVLDGWRVLHPESIDKFPQADDKTLVFSGECYGTRILLLSDLGRPGQEILMQRETNLCADIVVTGLPEESEPLCDGLLERIQPKVIIIADSEFSAKRRASPKFRDRLSQQSAPVIYTRLAGGVTVKCGENGCEVHAIDGTHLNLHTLKPWTTQRRLPEDIP